MNEDSLSAIWMDGPLYWEIWNKKYIRLSDFKVGLKYSYSIQSIDEFLNNVKQSLIVNNNMIFGISQDPNTKDYIIVFQDKYCKFCSEKYIIPRKWNKWYESCKSCKVKDLTNLISSGIKWKNGPLYWDAWNKKCVRRSDIEIVLKYPHNLQIIDEFLNEFTNIKETNEDSLSATWIDGPLYWETWNKEYIRRSDIEVILKYSHNIQHIDEFLSKV
ncbi:kinase-like domain-containing protein [Rhizophagus irregularis DAOM 181602=DAOM 197198]|nr:kinase-like domain-containing protein [Rhizophagus irregularis DAOM 181602=DAOM 197198]